MQIEKVANGYVVKTLNSTYVYSTLDEVFDSALLHFEGLSPSFGKESWGKVTIQRGKP